MICRKIYLLFLIVCTGVFFSSCKDVKKYFETKSIINKWVDKEIIFPPISQCNLLGQDTTFNPVCFNRTYKNIFIC